VQWGVGCIVDVGRRLMMDVKPVKRYRVPAYPTRLEVLADPGVLAQHVPHGWNRNAVTATALGVFLAANSYTHAESEGAQPTDSKAAVVAPIFEHGDGRGSIGCVAVAPPVFLSEEEALQVINEELAQAGIETTGTNVVLDGVALSRRREDYRMVDGEYKREVIEDESTRTPLKADLTDSKHHIAIEFLSNDDYFPLGGASSMSTVQSYDFKDIAKRVVDTVKKDGSGVYFGTFYDPMVSMRMDYSAGDIQEDWQTRWTEAREKGGEEARRLLRLQVKDFIDWLKGQGVI
jgi:hypothetical protein